MLERPLLDTVRFFVCSCLRMMRVSLVPITNKLTKCITPHVWSKSDHEDEWNFNKRQTDSTAGLTMCYMLAVIIKSKLGKNIRKFGWRWSWENNWGWWTDSSVKTNTPQTAYFCNTETEGTQLKGISTVCILKFQVFLLTSKPLQHYVIYKVWLAYNNIAELVI